LYLPYETFPLAFMSIITRSTAGVAVIASLARSEARHIDPDLGIDRIVPLSNVVRESVAEARFRTLLLAAFALIALMLAAVGIFGLMSYSVAQRTREIGIRVALGATARQVVLPVVGEGLWLAVAGSALGMLGSFAASQLLRTFLYQVGPTDPLTYAAVAALLLGVALVATLIPSRRAARVDPIIALRSE
jgi:putative ABC transport system permease protein